MGARFEPADRLHGGLVAPPDKSISHRAVLFAAMATGTSRVSRCLDAGDVRSTLAAVRALGSEIEEHEAGDAVDLVIEGIGLRGPAAASGPIACGNAGTLVRLLAGWLAGCDGGEWTLDGDESLRTRPMRRISEPLRKMGAIVETSEAGTPPLRITGAQLAGISHQLEVASAQVKSCLICAALNASGETVLKEPAPSRDHTEQMLAAMGAPIDLGASLRVGGVDALEPLEIRVPGDLSSAAFHVLAAVLVPGSEIRIEGVGLNPTRTGLLAVLERMGASVESEDRSVEGGEPVGDLLVRSGELTATRVEGDEIPLAIDELPLIALAGCFAEGETVIAGASELRHKESDRIATVVSTIRALGGEAEEALDGLVVRGSGGLAGGTVDAAGDHRIAMMAAVAGVASREGAEVLGMDAAAISYPGFVGDLERLTGAS